MTDSRPAPAASQVLDRVLVLEMVRVTEAAAIGASKLIGRGDTTVADAQTLADGTRAYVSDQPNNRLVVLDLARRHPRNFWADPQLFFTDGPLVNLGADFCLSKATDLQELVGAIKSMAAGKH